MISRIRGLLSDRGGVAAVEFALVAPVLIALWLGMTEFANVHLVARKANIAAQSVADLIAQERTATTGELDDVLQAATQIMEPFPIAPLSVQITSVVADGNGVLSAEWEYPGVGGGAIPPEAVNLVGPDESVIVVTLSYQYQPILNSVVGVITLSERAFARPRLQLKVVRGP